MPFPVLIDDCGVLHVNEYAVFIVHGGLTLKTLILKKKKKTTFVNVIGAIIRFMRRQS